MKELMQMSDVIAICEHRLFPSELYRLEHIGTDFIVQSKASADLEDRYLDIRHGHCGVALFWKKSMAHKVRSVNVNSDRICAIELIGECKNDSLFIISVYMPHSACKIASYEGHVNILNGLIQECKQRGEVVVIGDMNCKFSNEMGPRFSGTCSDNAKYMTTCLYSNNMTVLDGLALCNGPCYTFCVEGVGKSYIDHVAVTEGLVEGLIDCVVHEDCVLNTSDHLPISVTLRRCIKEACSIKDQGSIAWHKLAAEHIKTHYTDRLENVIQSSFSDILQNKADNLESTCIDEIVDKLSHCLKSVSDEMPQVKRPSYLKPYWNRKLKLLAKCKKQSWYQWKQNGCPRENNDSFIAYKEAKRMFRQEQRQAEKEYEQKKIRNIAAYHDIDQSLFWYLVNKRKKRSNCSHPIKVASGDIVSDPDDLCKEWALYFQKLYTPSDKPQYDSQFKAKVERELNDMVRESYDVPLVMDPFHCDEITAICKKMKDNKAPGYDRISAEHFKHAGSNCIHVLTYVFNRICETEKVPLQFKRGVLIPIPKGNKDRSIQDNYRGITLLQTMRKIFEKAILKKKISKWVKDSNVIDDLQGAAQEHCSSLETNWVVRETVSHYLEGKSSVYVCMLDVKKAFDSVWQKALFHKLYNVGMDPCVWRVLIDLYSEPECCIRINGRSSQWIKAMQGIIQGGPLSMFNYEIINNDLIRDLKACNAGTVIGSLITTAPAFADDLTIIAPTRSALQKLLSIAYKHSCQWRYEYNVDKSAIIVYGNDEHKPTFSIGNSCINVTAAHEHVGTILAPSKQGTIEYVKKRVEACSKPGYAIMSLGSKSAPMTPKSASTLYWSVCAPKLTYGYQVMDIPQEAMSTTESFHAKMAKTIQGLPDQASNIGSVAALGWMTICGYVEMLTLLYFMQIIRLPADCIYKKLFIHRYCHHLYSPTKQHYGPVKKFLDMCIKYNVLSVIKAAVEECIIPSKNEWKKLVKIKIWEMENKKWCLSSTLYSTLERIRSVMPSLQMSSWWFYAQANPSDTWKCRTLLRLLLGCSDLRSCQFRYKKEGTCDPYCCFCDERSVENVTHILFECKENHELRAKLWGNVIECCPDALCQQIKYMSASEKTSLMLTGLNNSFINEWMPLYRSVMNYIYKIYISRIKCP
jgi:endonuclease/exonuclease/phosphatase family metal-dependent hydrolase